MAYIPGGPSITVGNVTMTDLQNLIVLHGVGDNTNNKTTLRKNSSTAAYQVPTGKKFRCYAVQISFASSSATGDVNTFIAQSDNDVGSTGSTTALTNAVYPANISTTYMKASSDSNRRFVREDSSIFGFEIAAGKYVSAGNGGTAGSYEYIVYGYEVAA